MNLSFLTLTVATLAIWIVAIAGLYQRVLVAPKWFEHSAASLERRQAQVKTWRVFWITISVIFVAFIAAATLLNWENYFIRFHALAGLATFVIAVLAGALFFDKELREPPVTTVETPTASALQKRTDWLRWATLRSVLHILAALFVLFGFFKSL